MVWWRRTVFWWRHCGWQRPSRSTQLATRAGGSVWWLCWCMRRSINAECWRYEHRTSVTPASHWPSNLPSTLLHVSAVCYLWRLNWQQCSCCISLQTISNYVHVHYYCDKLWRRLTFCTLHNGCVIERFTDVLFLSEAIQMPSRMWQVIAFAHSLLGSSCSDRHRLKP